MRKATILCACILAASAARSADYYDMSKGQKDQIRDKILKLRQEAEKKRKKDEAKARKQAQAKSLAEVKRLLKKGEEEMKDGNYSAAQSFFRAIESCQIPGASKYTSKAKGHILQIEEMARKRLNEAEVKHMLREYVAEAAVLEQVLNDFAHTKASRRAKARLSFLSREPKAASTIALAKAKAEEDAQNYGEAVRLYREIRKKWPDEIAGLKAKYAIERLRSDPEIGELLREHAEFEASKVCPGWINIAHNYRINDDRDRAREYLQRVLDKFPGTTYAEEAKRKLAEL